MSAEKRRAMIARAREKVAAHGLEFDNDPRFLASEERWISGEITIAEFRAEYLDLIMQRQEDEWLKRAFDRSKR
ncbi:hypothetical protein [Neorhizobium sp. NCHU2750]|uniref:hypothetical protein n=1 Tax=Neorhizobium sp. NCHU2750 TaxID=1825976 RepID=UPI000E74DEC5|nr:hypothetical protein NCHU2750_15390 [Neorhizobium sp. NCHU2750]